MILGTSNPRRRELDDLAKKMSLAVGRNRYWTGGYLYILLNLEKYQAKYGHDKYRIPHELLCEVCRIAGIDQKEKAAIVEIEKKEHHLKPEIYRQELPFRLSSSPIISKKLQNKINRKIRFGYGQGRGISYKSWLTAREVRSLGLTSRTNGNKIPRMYTLFSTLEQNYFYWLEYLSEAVDIREQYPLSIDETLLIADHLGYRHPMDPRTHEPIVMTSDFVLDFEYTTKRFISVKSIKPSTELAKNRVLEKLEIEKEYWKSRNVDWSIVTEKEIPPIVIKNIKRIRPYYNLHDRLHMTMDQIKNAKTFLEKALADNTLKMACDRCDRALHLREGNALSLTYHFLAVKEWKVDLHNPIAQNERLILLNW